MAFPEISGPLPLVGNPPLSFRFSVLFFALGRIPNPIDILFQKVSGLGVTVETEPVKVGGQNNPENLPIKVKYDNLVLHRGLVVGSPLVIEFNNAMYKFKFNPANVLVTLLDNTRLPIAAWFFRRAYPVRWSISDLDAESNSVMIEQIELNYESMQIMRL